MKPLRRIGVALALLGAMVAVLAVPLAAADRGHDRSSRAEVVGYFIQWGIYGRGYFVKDVATSGSADKLTAINYAFVNAPPSQYWSVQDDEVNQTVAISPCWTFRQMSFLLGACPPEGVERGTF